MEQDYGKIKSLIVYLFTLSPRFSTIDQDNGSIIQQRCIFTMPIKAFIYVFIASFIGLFSNTASAQETLECKSVLASMFNKNYCAESYEMSALREFAFGEQALQRGLDPEISVKQAPYKLLYKDLWADAFSHLLPDTNLQVRPKEMELFLSSYNSVHNAELHGLTLQLNALNQLLRDRKFDPQKRTLVRKQRNDLRHKIKSLKSDDNNTAYDEETESRLDYQIKSTGQSIIIKWKENKSLYNLYGGVCVKIDNNIEPLEAMLSLHRYMADEGMLAFYNEKFEAHYRARIAQIESALARHKKINDPQIINEFYKVPYWIQDAVDAKKPYVDQLVELYKNVGYTGHIPYAVKDIVLESQKDE